jgi:hypothetical protein
MLSTAVLLSHINIIILKLGNCSIAQERGGSPSLTKTDFPSFPRPVTTLRIYFSVHAWGFGLYAFLGHYHPADTERLRLCLLVEQVLALTVAVSQRVFPGIASGEFELGESLWEKNVV